MEANTWAGDAAADFIQTTIDLCRDEARRCGPASDIGLIGVDWEGLGISPTCEERSEGDG